MAKAKTAKRIKPSRSNKSGDPTQNLQHFNLLDLQQYTLEKTYDPTASKDFHLFFVGRDDVQSYRRILVTSEVRRQRLELAI